jgi:murein tripeptide amidase MpaA
MKYLSAFLAVIIAIVAGCATSDEFTGFSYDPEGVTETSDKEIQQQYKKVIGLDNRSVWISNEFAGARINDFYQVNDSLYRAVIEPENEEINNSPWYAFKIWSDTARTINLQLSYKHGNHRYIPKLSDTGQRWQQIDSTMYSPDTLDGTATLTLNLQPNPRWVAAQEMLTLNDYTRWMKLVSQRSWVSLDTVGYSHDQRPITKMNIDQTSSDEKRGVLIITSRQHPPEITGAIASKIFINELTSDSEVAQIFRHHFEVWAYPLLNPDGVQRGHWRHNAAGVDLNRDWQNFNQPETKAVRDDLLPLQSDSLRTVYYGIDFHSTNENLFYPINRDISTFPEDFTYQWIEELKAQFPDFSVSVEPFDTSSPITKNWIHRTFGADAVTYEVDDQANRDSLRIITRANAEIIMQQLLEAKEQAQLSR